MADFHQDTYQPMDGDLYIQEVRAGRFTIYRYSFQSWEQLGAGHSEQDIKAMIAPMQLLGESVGHRRYYRPTGVRRSKYAELIDKAQLAPRTQIELFEGGKVLITDESEDPFLPTFIELDSEGAIKLGGFLLSHQDYLNKHRDAKQAEQLLARPFDVYLKTLDVLKQSDQLPESED